MASDFFIPVIGVTGSIGKTSTKELLTNILIQSGKKVLYTEGNQNTVISCALSVLKMAHWHEAAVFEMGISRRGEMLTLASIVQPTTALITAIGHSHAEGLGSLSDIAMEKRAIFSFFKENSIGIINGDTHCCLPSLINTQSLSSVLKKLTKFKRVKFKLMDYLYRALLKFMISVTK